MHCSCPIKRRRQHSLLLTGLQLVVQVAEQIALSWSKLSSVVPLVEAASHQSFSADATSCCPCPTPITSNRCRIVAATPTLNSATEAYVADRTRCTHTQTLPLAFRPHLRVQTFFWVMRLPTQAAGQQVIVRESLVYFSHWFRDFLRLGCVYLCTQ